MWQYETLSHCCYSCPLPMMAISKTFLDVRWRWSERWEIIHIASRLKGLDYGLCPCWYGFFYWLDRNYYKFCANRFFYQTSGMDLLLTGKAETSIKKFQIKFFYLVNLFAIQYGLTFCLYVRSLYEAPLHCPFRLSTRQLDLMSKSRNELLRHWRSI